MIRYQDFLCGECALAKIMLIFIFHKHFEFKKVFNLPFGYRLYSFSRQNANKPSFLPIFQPYRTENLPGQKTPPCQKPSFDTEELNHIFTGNDGTSYFRMYLAPPTIYIPAGRALSCSEVALRSTSIPVTV